MAKKKAKKKTTKSKGGRPKTYDAAFIERMAAKLVPWFNAKKKKKRYWLKDFAILNGFPSSRISVWVKESKYFAEQYELAKDIQESRLVHGGIDETMNATMVRLSLQNVAEWRDQKDMNLTGNLIFNVKKNYD